MDIRDLPAEAAEECLVVRETDPRGREQGQQKENGVNQELAADVLELFARLETDGSAGRNAHFLARPGVAADAALAGLHLEHPEAAQLDSLPTLHRQPHRVED